MKPAAGYADMRREAEMKTDFDFIKMGRQIRKEVVYT
jgi:hypothetical protein